ncbi:uncharacterized protein LTR77_011087 [Saxophila tyrrhenica]|uniref:Glycosyltransferase family 25 protein n=1 Tax=Saxophila tyrrhenica TaxID=1690608 RepID=A0AAV9NWA0_9PEZI|nr:hypothetical protein LTR77_011087 [Saxophila tyrrhenica]
MDRRTQRALLIVLFFGVTVVLYRTLGLRDSIVQRGGGSRSGGSAPDEQTSLRVDPKKLDLANATLGFGAVLAVSREGSPRREGLLLASNITEIDITIPDQPKWTEEDVNRIRADRDSRISRGSALAWLGHLNALQWFLSSDLESVMILEDDVDWDIHLRTTQIPTAAAAVRQLVLDKTTPAGTLQHYPEENNFWGNISTWDILYLGHCGDIFRPSSWTAQVPRVLYNDPTLPPRREMHPYTQAFLQSIAIPDDTRMIHQSIFPLCTFGFAVTRNAARRLLTEIAPKESEGGTMAYDVRVLEGCRDLGLRCWSANPELFHHMDMESEIALATHPEEGRTGGGGESAEKAGADEKGRLKTLRAGAAPNIACGARSKSFYTKDERTLEFLREQVGRQGKCLKDIEESGAKGADGERYDGPGDPRLYR